MVEENLVFMKSYV